MIRPSRRKILATAEYTGCLPLLRRLTGRRHAILTFHRIHDGNSLPDGFCSCPSHSVKNFRAALSWCKRHYRFVPLSDLVRFRGDRTPLCAVTFDDGWRDNYRFALPVLRELDIPATVFIVTSKIGAKTPFWQQKLGECFRKANSSNDCRDALKASFRDLHDANDFTPALFRRTVSRLKRLPARLREPLIDRVAEQCGVEEQRERLFLNEAEIHAMREHGINFGSHTHTHPVLTTEEPSDIHAELFDSRERLQQILDEPVLMLSYPNGNWSVEIARMAATVGYRIACTTIHGHTSAHSNELALPRIELPYLPYWSTT